MHIVENILAKTTRIQLGRYSRSWLRAEPRASASGSPVAPNLAVRVLGPASIALAVAQFQFPGIELLQVRSKRLANQCAAIQLRSARRNCRDAQEDHPGWPFRVRDAEVNDSRKNRPMERILA